MVRRARDRRRPHARCLRDGVGHADVTGVFDEARDADDGVPLPGWIVFGRDVGTGGKFFTLRPDGTDERFLVDDIGGCLMCGEWSPDGSRMMFAALTPDGRVTTATMGADGTGLSVLPIGDPTLHLAPGSWAPDGLHMAFDGWDDSNPGRRGAYIGAADGSGTPRLITADLSADVVFGFSPDGSYVLTFREGGARDLRPARRRSVRGGRRPIIHPGSSMTRRRPWRCGIAPVTQRPGRPTANSSRSPPSPTTTRARAPSTSSVPTERVYAGSRRPVAGRQPHAGLPMERGSRITKASPTWTWSSCTRMAPGDGYWQRPTGAARFGHPTAGRSGSCGTARRQRPIHGDACG